MVDSYNPCLEHNTIILFNFFLKLVVIFIVHFGKPKVWWAAGINICTVHHYAQDRSGWNYIIYRVTKGQSWLVGQWRPSYQTLVELWRRSSGEVSLQLLFCRTPPPSSSSGSLLLLLCRPLQSAAASLSAPGQTLAPALVILDSSTKRKVHVNNNNNIPLLYSP